MRALTLYRPWPYAILDLPEGQAKRIENRRWRPPSSLIGAPLAIHAGRTYDRDGLAFIIGRGFNPPGPTECPEGIVGVVTVVDYLDESELWSTQRLREMPGQEGWFFGPFGWVLADVIRLATPVPCKGMQGFWHLPHDVHCEVARQVGMQMERRHAAGGR